MNILGIDPGLNATGLGALYDGRMSQQTIRPDINHHNLAFRVREIAEKVRLATCDLYGLDLLVIEKPQVYERWKSKGDPNDLVDLAVLVGALIVVIPAKRILLPQPQQWKGSVPKRIHHRRIRTLYPDLGRCSADAMDAVGLALYGAKHAHP